MAPRLRTDLVATTADEQGVACVEVVNPLSGASFRFYDFEYALAQQLTGQPLEAVVAWAQSTYGIALSSDTLHQFLQKLAGLGFLADDGLAFHPSQPPPLTEPLNGAPAGLGGAASRKESAPQPEEPFALLPRIEVLAGPLPPVPARDDAAPAPGETPLASIARAIAEATVPPPPGSLDGGLAAVVSPPSDGAGNSSAIPRNAQPLPSAVTPPDAPSRESSVSDLAHEVDHSHDDRRQPPRPELVVMPPMAEPSPVENPPRRRWPAALVLLLLGGGISAAVWFLRPGEGPPTPRSAAPSPPETTPRVHVVSPQPTTFYRWFAVAGVVVPAKDDVLAFRSGGRVQDIMPPGTTFSAGEAIARLQGVAERELMVNRLRSRVAFLEQLRDSSRAEGSGDAVRQAEIKLTLRKQDLTKAQAALAELEILPRAAGEIAELMVQKGATVKPGTAVFRVRATGARATFGFGVEDAARARALTFCRIETVPGTGGVDGGAIEVKARAIDCTLSPATGGAAVEPRLAVDLVGTSGVAPGTEIRLASGRYDGVFPVPRSAVVREGAVDHVWIVPGGRRVAESRAVELGASIDALALIAHGIAVGDAVIVDPPVTLKTGSEVEVVQ